jgi:hypothetical protein
VCTTVAQTEHDVAAANQGADGVRRAIPEVGQCIEQDGVTVVVGQPVVCFLRGRDATGFGACGNAVRRVRLIVGVATEREDPVPGLGQTYQRIRRNHTGLVG